jgi:ferredoxin
MSGQDGMLLKKCTECRHHNPPLYDEFIGEPSEAPEPPEGRFAEVEAIEALPQEERAAYFQRVYSKCIRCYACRDVCPCCTCRECFVDARRENWVGKQNNLPENRFYGITRVMHIGDRCIECGECERVCPMDLPLMTMNRKVIRDMNELFGTFESGMEIGEPKEKLMTYEISDPEEFM